MVRNILRSIALMVLLSPAAFGQVVHYGVCVGINDYPGYLNDLQYCVNDAQQMLYRLRDHQGWASANLTLKLDGDATKQHIIDAISAMPRSSGYSDLFHYSGHGDYSGIFVVDETDLSPSDLQGAFGSSYYQYASYVDACHSGIFPRDMTHGVISSACTVDELASETSALQHGVFSYYLIEGLTNNTAGGSDGIVTAEELHNYAAPRTTSYMPSQHPQVRDNWSGDLSLASFSVGMSGPVALAVGQQGTWTASAIGGTGSYTYAWYFRSSDTGGQWYGPVSNSNSYTTQMHNFDGYLDLRADVTSGVQQTSATRHVSCTDCSGGPLSPQIAVDTVQSTNAPAGYIIEQNYPNPFNPTTEIRFALPKPSYAKLIVYDMLGREVARLADGQMGPGYHSVTWNASNVSSGIYIYRLVASPAEPSSAGNFVQVKRMIVMK